MLGSQGNLFAERDDPTAVSGPPAALLLELGPALANQAGVRPGPKPPQFSSVPAVPAQFASSRPSASRLMHGLAFVAFMGLGGVGAYLFMAEPGKLQVGVRPQVAQLSVDGVVVAGASPFLLVKPPGVYHARVARPGYEPWEQNVQISAGQAGRVAIDLGPAPDTGFELTSRPAGGSIWLDGQRLTVDEPG